MVIAASQDLVRRHRGRVVRPFRPDLLCFLVPVADAVGKAEGGYRALMEVRKFKTYGSGCNGT